MESMDDDLARRVMGLTWRRLLADAAAHGGAASSRAPAPRYSDPTAMDGTRQAIVAACREADASEALLEYFSTRWLEQFAPRLA